MRRTAAVTLAATWVLVVVGGVVRATGSGLGCPDWPRCHGRWLPPLEKEPLLEWLHRSVAAVLGLLVVAVVVMAWQGRRSDPRSLRLALAVLGGVGLESWLGRVIVVGELDAMMVTVHLALSMVLMALLCLLALPPVSLRRSPEREGRLWAGSAGVLSVILFGAFVRGEGGGLAFPDWPLMDGGLFPVGLDVTARFVHWAHRLGAAVVGLYLGYLVLYLYYRARDRVDLFLGAVVVLGLYLVQALLGAANVWFELETTVQVGHLALAGLTWTAAFAVGCRVRRPPLRRNSELPPSR